MRQSSLRTFQLLVLGVCFCTSASADWQGLWKTPQQQALQAYENSDYESLLNDAPDESWSGLAHYETGNFTEASQAFAAHVEQLRADGNPGAATRALYNQGVSDVMAGQFAQAIERFDEALTENPDFTQALHNRDIAQKLLEMQQQQENSSETGESGESSDQQEGQSPDGESSQQGDASDGEQANDADGDTNPDQASESSAQGDSPTGDSQGDDPSDAAAQSEAEQEQEAADALDALAAEAARQEQSGEEPPGDGTQESVTDTMIERPLSEAEQATEQLLRRIPDDPAGLLRRKLEQSHRNEYPEVRDAAEPW